MLSDKFALYGSAPSMRKENLSKKKPVLATLLACIVAPLLLFVFVYWARSFSFHFESDTASQVICYLLLVVPLIFGYTAINRLSVPGEREPMILLVLMCLIAVILGLVLGDNNYHSNMHPYYSVGQLNSYPNVDPSKYGGQQLMDAGQIEFTSGSKVDVQKSMGFKNGDVYCVAPIVSGGGNGTSKQSSFDFWAVGLNCCSGHAPDFHCGEYANPKTRKGLRLMDQDKKDMYRLVVQKAAAEYNLKAPHPIFLYWLADPAAEISAYQDDGYRNFITATVSFLCGQLILIVIAVTAFAMM